MTQNRYNKKSNFLPLLITACISFAIPFGLYYLTSQKSSIPKQSHQEYDPGYGRDAMILQALNEINERLHANLNLTLPAPEPAIMIQSTSNNLEIKWVDSPVMQTWVYNEKARVWETAVPYKDSFRSSPTLIFGLRNDGVVVWDKVKR